MIEGELVVGLAPRDSRELRAWMVNARDVLTHTGFAIAEALSRISKQKLYHEWGYHSFSAYVVCELEVDLKFAYRAAELYDRYESVWDDAQRVPWSRLLEAMPLLTAGVETPKVLVEKLQRPTSTVFKVREWKDEKLDRPSPLATPPAGEAMPLGHHADVDPILVHPDMELTRRWRSNRDHAEWVEVRMRLPRQLYDRWVKLLFLARQLLGLKRVPGDERGTLAQELDAMVGEVAVEWQRTAEQRKSKEDDGGGW